MFKCPRCSLEYPSYNSLSKHTRTVYKLSGEALYREYNAITKTPTCKCGCGTPTKWRIDRGYAEYIAGHNSKGENNIMYGKTHTREAKNSISKKRKEKFASGEYTFINSIDWSERSKKVWQQDGYKEKMKEARKRSGWKKKLSSRMGGINHPFYGKKRPEHSKLMKTPEMLEKIFAKRSMTDIEQMMALMLDQIDVKYYSQFFLVHEADTYAYDFKLKDLPILIEVDGDYWHGGPSADIHVPFVNEVKEKDILKTKIAEHYGYTVIRFWGSDINERPFWVIQQLLTHMNEHNPTI
jgi:very-short-patch-repair endonuclease